VSFRSIGSVLADVIAEAELRSRAPSTAANEGGGPSDREGGRRAALPSEEVAPAMEEKVRGRTPAVQSQERGARLGESPRSNVPALVLVSVNDRCTAPPTNRSRPTPAVHLSVVLVNGHVRTVPM
jgi:hypothetical protein